MATRLVRRPPFRIYAITDCRAVPDHATLMERAAALLSAAPAGRLAIQLRDKELAAGSRMALAGDLRQLCHRHGALLFINGDIELARSCGADGVHFPETALAAASLQPELLKGNGKRLWLGGSCHDAQGLQAAAAQGLDFVTLSPVLPSPGKAAPGEELGWKNFSELSRQTELPVFALGGLGGPDAASAAANGAHGVAAIRSLWQGGDAPRLITELLQPFAPVGCSARGGLIGRALSSVVGSLVMLQLLACGPQSTTPANLPTDDDDDSSAPQQEITDIPLPAGPFGLHCSSVEPDDLEIAMGSTGILDPPWANANDCGSINPTSTGLLVRLSGNIEDLVVDTWDGDNDSFFFRVERELFVHGVLRWEPLQGDFDARVMCGAGTQWRDLFGRGLATTAVPESHAGQFALLPGDSCWIVVVGYSGQVGSYDLWLEERVLGSAGRP
ncbi:MAG: hypothetical protein CMP23_04795 [Rickettsiales bacterium]|nr:hypothetical protein [Rickettsiales bacterium]